jgi:23S rRNA pseudouridine1911/1915/1917 synthase
VFAEDESENLIFVVEAESSNLRLDAFLAEKIAGWSRSRLQKLIDDKAVLVNQKRAKASYKVRAGDQIEVELNAPETAVFEPENILLDIVFEDEQIAVVNKPAGMVVHPGAGVTSATLANAAAFHFQIQNSKSEIQNRAGIVHRLDKNTSGLIVVAKTQAAHENLSEQFCARRVYKSYCALVHGATAEENGKIELPIARDRTNRLRMRIDKRGRGAVSLWRARERFEKFTLLDVEIKTGRTHQIRVHLAAVKHPLVGDELYNGGRDKNVANLKVKTAIGKLNRFFLHAQKLCFDHPTTNERLDFFAALPPELEEFLAILRG